MSLLSIIIPVYNAEKTIGRTLDSLNNITPASRGSVEVIIINDGSQDRSMKIIESKTDDRSPLNFIVLNQENKGTAAARNTGLEHCSGNWILFLDADDELSFDPIPYIKQCADYSSLGFSIRFWKNSKSRGMLHPTFVTLGNHLDVCTAANPFSLSNVIFKKNCIRALFDTRFIYLEDWVFWIMNPLIFEKMKIFPRQISAILHVHGGNKSSNYATVGNYRKRVADTVLANFADKLDRRQKNNLLIQSQIGLILQGKKIPLNTFFRFPCDMVLYTKLVIYSLLRGNFPKLDVYGR